MSADVLDRFGGVWLLPLALAVIALPLVGSFSSWATLTVAGLAMGMMIFLMASGLSLVFGLMDVLNFGHSAFISFGAFIAASVLAALAPGSARRQLLLNLAALMAAIVSPRRLRPRRRLRFRARDHAPGLWRPSAPDPDHHRRAHRRRAD